MNLISVKELNREVAKGSPIWILIAKEIKEPALRGHPQKVMEILDKFLDVFQDELPDQLSPLRDIQHAIDLVPRSTLSNLPHYQINPTEHQEL